MESINDLKSESREHRIYILMCMTLFEEADLNRLEDVERSEHCEETKHNIVFVVSPTVVHLNNKLSWHFVVLQILKYLEI